ncbi:hypothetical protein GSI_07183 [Ganoderma sinense ZZ0214-1]|uniref:Uncharacterized protein n=1 Tax=Ganoderma sinense ZZ0214-1 TaxID=1077348 RepID=A0A2G8S9Q4_9APHY|nr:hypothetical protein GSI_07183 [Ganoderma sinense ZZ0214-1]
MPARPSALARRRARYTTLVEAPPPQDAMLEGLAEEILGLTISDSNGGQEITAQSSSRLWTSRQQYQDSRPPLERVSSTAINAAIVETFQSVTTADTPSSTQRLPSAIVTSSQPAGSSASPSEPSIHPETGISPSSLSDLRDVRRLPISTTIEDFTGEDPLLIPGYGSSSGSSVAGQTFPSISHPVHVQPQRTPQSWAICDVPNESQVPRRFPRRTAAEKAIQDDLNAAAGIDSDLDDLQKLATLEPTLERYYQLRARLDEAGKGTELLRHQDPRVQQSRDQLHARHAHIHETLTVWADVVGLPDMPRVVNTSYHFDVPIDGYAELAQLDPASASFIKHTLKVLPSTMDTIATRFRMDGKLICHANYNPASGPVSYPSTCTNHPTPQSQCNAPLLDEAGKPLKICSMHPFEEYLGSLFSNPVIENYLTSNKIPSSAPSILRTPHDAQFLRSFQGQDGKLFCDSPDGEARLSFALFVDFFAAEGMKERGPNTSLGIVVLACLDLPVEIRYKPEYMYLVCIIPGPDEPTLTQLNHYIDPVVTIFLESWVKGVKLSRTASRGELGLLSATSQRHAKPANL